MTRWYKALAAAAGAALALGIVALGLPAAPAAAAGAPAAPPSPAPGWGPGFGGRPGGGWGHGFGMGPGGLCAGAAGDWALDAGALERYVKANPALVAGRASWALDNLDAREEALRDAIADLENEIKGVTDAGLKAVLSARLELLKDQLDDLDGQRAFLKALLDYARSLTAAPQ